MKQGLVKLHPLVLLIPLLVFGNLTAHAETAPPPPGTGDYGQICFRLVNKASTSVAGRVQVKSKELVTFRIDAGQTVEDCLVGTTFGGNKVLIMITNLWGMVLQSCYTTTWHEIAIKAFRQEEGYSYAIDCRS